MRHAHATALLACAALAAVTAQEKSFEVASIKPSDPNPGVPLLVAVVLPQPGGGLSARNAPLTRLIQYAWAVEDFQVIGGPAWASTERFDLSTKGPAGASTIDAAPMLKTLLADRFKLKVRSETRGMPTFSLVLARADRRLGPKFAAFTRDCATVRCGVAPTGAGGPGGFTMRATGQPMLVLTRLLGQAIGRVIVDDTGLTGLYDWELAVDMTALAGRMAQLGVTAPPPSAIPDTPSFATTLEEDFGLKLQSQTSPVPVVVIESAERPTPD